MVGLAELDDPHLQPPYAGSTWRRFALPLHADDLGSAAFIELAPAHNGVLISFLSGCLDGVGETELGWSGDDLQRIVEFALLIRSVPLVDGCWAGIDPETRSFVTADQGERVAVAAWARFVVLIGESHFSQFSPAPTLEPDEWDWTAGLSDDQLLGAGAMSGTVLAWPAADLSFDSLVRLTRAWERQAAIVERAVLEHDLDHVLLAQREQLVADIERILRSDRPSKGLLTILIATLGSLTMNLLASAVWEVVRPHFVHLLSLLS